MLRAGEFRLGCGEGGTESMRWLFMGGGLFLLDMPGMRGFDRDGVAPDMENRLVEN